MMSHTCPENYPDTEVKILVGPGAEVKILVGPDAEVKILLAALMEPSLQRGLDIRVTGDTARAR